MTRFGLDYAWGGASVTPAAHRALGSSFACRYLSWEPSKNLSIQEAKTLHAAGIDLVLVWETIARRAYSGYQGGWDDAQAATGMADALAKALGFTNWPVIYFAPFDDDATPGDQAAINSYFQGVAKYRGPRRAGAYLGYWPLSRLFNANVGISYGWQTYAWSGGNWDPRAQLRQYSNSHTVAGIGVDYDLAVQADFGQLLQPAPAPRQPAPKPAPKPVDRYHLVFNRAGNALWQEMHYGPLHMTKSDRKAVQDGVAWALQTLK